MLKKNIVLSLHLLANILAQGAVIALVPQGGWPGKILQAVVAIVGVLVAFFDTSTTTTQP